MVKKNKAVEESEQDFEDEEYEEEAVEVPDIEPPSRVSRQKKAREESSEELKARLRKQLDTLEREEKQNQFFDTAFETVQILKERSKIIEESMKIQDMKIKQLQEDFKLLLGKD